MAFVLHVCHISLIQSLVLFENYHLDTHLRMERCYVTKFTTPVMTDVRPIATLEEALSLVPSKDNAFSCTWHPMTDNFSVL